MNLGDNVGQILITSDSAYNHAGATSLMVYDSGSTPIDSAEGFLARFVHSGTKKSGSFAVEIEVPAAQPALASNGQVVLTGQASSALTTLTVVGNDGTNNTDAVDIHNEGTGRCLLLTPDDTDSVALTVVGKASSTVTVVAIDGDTGDWIGGSDDVAMVEIVGGATANADAGGSLFAITSSATPKAATEGLLARFLHTGSATASSWAVEIETANTQGALNVNNNVTLAGASGSGTLLTITHNGTSGDADAMTIASAGSGDSIQITPTDTDSGGINVVGKAAGTVPLVILDSSTNNMNLNDNKGQLLIQSDAAYNHAGATGLMVFHQTGQPITAAEGFLARFVSSGTAQTNSSAVEIEVPATQPALAVNGIVAITGQNAAGAAILQITNTAASGDANGIEIASSGAGHAIEITPTDTDSAALLVTGKASSSVTVVTIDGDTGDWIGGADDVAMVEIVGGSTANADAGGGLLAVISGTNPASASEGFLCRFIHTGTATANAYAVEIETTNTTPCLMLNNQMTISGSASGGVMLDITGADTSTDTVQLIGVGSGDVLQITANATTATALNIVGIASTTASLMTMDGSAGAGWIGAANTGMVHLLNDGTAAQTTTTMLYIAATGTNKSGQLGTCARFIDGTTSGGGTEYAVAISSANNKGLWIDTGGAVIDDGLTVGTTFAATGNSTFGGTLGITGDLTASGSITGDGGDELTGYLLEVEVETGTDEQLLVADSGQIFANTAAQGETTFTLPDAAAGLWYIICDNSKTGGDDVQISPQVGDKIDGDTAGDDLVSSSDDAATCLIFAVDAVNWMTIQGEAGTWTAD